ncbi:hypothetical protein IPO96_00950 [Candidatus Saccharibacteria bacterium]|nr:MAG: hypothetical protein IPO96_00950 [Candidatus Saccharibacteria bacterium]
MPTGSSEEWFAEEESLRAWAAEMGTDYEIGTQGTVGGQPISEMGNSRIEGFLGRAASRLRELGDLPAIVNDDERRLHITPDQLHTMTDDEKDKWLLDALNWLIENPSAIINNLFDVLQDPRDEAV